ncbi:3-dehydroquinate dehydratase [SAR202 cluster bacterium AC-409-J13_OGT_754m]|nr:3-dehydroquinate dehydratase [SAR202 cluster bacterium AC-409-J13_OGT_754m]
MATFLIINGPNLDMLGTRAPEHYGSITLKTLEDKIKNRAKELGVDVSFCQSNIEGELVGFLNNNAETASGIIINPAGLTQVGYSLLDACIDSRKPVVEVHLSNIYKREEWRSNSIFSRIADSTVSGMKWVGYIAALEYLTSLNNMEV